MIIGSVLLILVAVVLLVLGLADGSSVLLTGSIGASLLAAVALVVGARQGAAAGETYLDDGLDDDLVADDAENDRQFALAGIGTERVGWGGRYGSDSTARSATVALPVEAPGPAETTEQTRSTGSGGAPAQQAQPPRQDGYASAPATERLTAQRDTGWEKVSAPVVGTTTTTVTAAAGTGPATSAAPGKVGTGAASARADVSGDDLDDEDPPDEPAPQVVSAANAARVARLSIDVLVIDGRPRYHLPGCVHLLGRESEPLPASEAVELGFTPCSLCEPADALLNDPHLG